MKIIYTSNFEKHGDHPDAVSIRGRVPKGYTTQEYTAIRDGKTIRLLAPSWDIYTEYRDGGDQLLYTERYHDEILSVLDPEEVYEDLLALTGGKPPILLCHEKEGEFCHRHLVAKWFEEELNLIVQELSAGR